MSEKIQGSVKWFSNKKGYGFITPAAGSSISDDIFVHQSSISSTGYRTLDEGWAVEFEIGKDDEGKPKAENVTAPGGGPCTGPRHFRTNRRTNHTRGKTSANADQEGGAGTGTGAGAGAGSAPMKQKRAGKKEPQPMWHDILSEEVKHALKDKQIRTSTGTIDISCGQARIKLGTRGYASIAHADKILAEGSFECNADGKATFEWKRAIKFTDCWGSWVDLSMLVTELNLTDESVIAVGVDETMETLMGSEPTDPKTTLEASGFEMRRVVLTTKRR